MKTPLKKEKNSPRVQNAFISKEQAKSHLNSPFKASPSQTNKESIPIPPKFGIKPSNPKIMFMKHELDSKEILNEKIKQAQLKEILEFSL